MAIGRVLWKSDWERGVTVVNFERRGWIRSDDDDDDWNVYWANVNNVHQIFGADSSVRLTDNQLLNHFPNHYELTRKDLMAKNIRRYRKEMEKEARYSPAELDFLPLTYSLPADYGLFVEQYRVGSTWIMKPPARSQGKGIFLINKLSQVKKWAAQRQAAANASGLPPSSYLVSRYIENPLLVGGKKFDLRMYVLVTSFRPLVAYMYRTGFGRFCTVEYSSDLDDIDNVYMHITNVAVQKFGDQYDGKHGGKWVTKNLRLYLEATRGLEATARLFDALKNIMYHSLKAVQNIMVNDKHCFECYGYDLLIDANLKPWLIEINASPSLSVTTASDRKLKTDLLNDIYHIVVPPHFPDFSIRNTDDPERLCHGTDFEILVDETNEAKEWRRSGMRGRLPSKH